MCNHTQESPGYSLSSFQIASNIYKWSNTNPSKKLKSFSKLSTKQYYLDAKAKHRRTPLINIGTEFLDRILQSKFKIIVTTIIEVPWEVGVAQHAHIHR